MPAADSVRSLPLKRGGLGRGSIFSFEIGIPTLSLPFSRGGDGAARAVARRSMYPSGVDHSIILPILTATSCGSLSVSRTIASISSPLPGSTIMFRLSAADLMQNRERFHFLITEFYF